MGATIVSSKAAAAFRHPRTANIIYLLFEETYDERTDPHTPSWACYAIGTFEQVLKKIFNSGSACEGGSLQTRKGPMKPEAYLKSWRTCFERPFQMVDQEIEITLGGVSMYDTIPDNQVETVLATLASINRPDIASELLTGPVKVSLHRDADIIIALYGVDTHLSISRVIRNLNGLAYSDTSLAPATATGKITVPSVHAYTLDQHNVVASLGGGPLKNLGWRYSAIGQYMRDVVFPRELQSSQSAYKLIRNFRAACEIAQPLPGSTRIIVTPASADDTYYLDQAKKLAVRLGLFPTAGEVPPFYETTMAVVRDRGEEYLLSFLEVKQVEWFLPLDELKANQAQHSLF